MFCFRCLRCCRCVRCCWCRCGFHRCSGSNSSSGSSNSWMVAMRYLLLPATTCYYLLLPASAWLPTYQPTYLLPTGWPLQPQPATVDCHRHCLCPTFFAAASSACCVGSKFMRSACCVGSKFMHTNGSRSGRGSLTWNFNERRSR